MTLTPRPLFTRSGDILLVENSPKDARLIREVLQDEGLPHRLHLAADGPQALRMLRAEPVDVVLSLPDLVLLDINLPGMSGIEVLTRIKDDPVLRPLPVLMLSTSRAERDLRESYAQHANGYLVKPPHYDDFAALMRETLHFWLERNCRPPPPPAPRRSTP